MVAVVVDISISIVEFLSSILFDTDSLLEFDFLLEIMHAITIIKTTITTISKIIERIGTNVAMTITEVLSIGLEVSPLFPKVVHSVPFQLEKHEQTPGETQIPCDSPPHAPVLDDFPKHIGIHSVPSVADITNSSP